MKIILLRHGRPGIDTRCKLYAHEYGDWVSAYNRAGIDQDYPPHAAARGMARECDFVICSDYPRSIESARQLGVTEANIIDAVFREFDIPFSSRLPGRFSPGVWTALYRLMWILGYSSNAESYVNARGRAELCMERLTAYAKQHGQVLFVGHGSLIWYLAKLLKRQGWRGQASTPKRYWDYVVYSQ